MTHGLTALLFLLAVAILGMRFYLANRRAARELRLQAEAARLRAIKETELLATLDRVKNRDDLTAAAAAIERDPVRAAKVIRRMMRKG